MIISIALCFVKVVAIASIKDYENVMLWKG